jgi:hypothetical protein
MISDGSSRLRESGCDLPPSTGREGGPLWGKGTAVAQGSHQLAILAARMECGQSDGMSRKSHAHGIRTSVLRRRIGKPVCDLIGPSGCMDLSGPSPSQTEKLV